MSIGFTSAASFSRGMALSMALRVNFRVTKDVAKLLVLASTSHSHRGRAT
jgi:hypothetical protein